MWLCVPPVLTLIVCTTPTQPFVIASSFFPSFSFSKLPITGLSVENFFFSSFLFNDHFPLHQNTSSLSCFSSMSLLCYAALDRSKKVVMHATDQAYFHGGRIGCAARYLRCRVASCWCVAWYHPFVCTQDWKRWCQGRWVPLPSVSRPGEELKWNKRYQTWGIHCQRL